MSNVLRPVRTDNERALLVEAKAVLELMDLCVQTGSYARVTDFYRSTAAVDRLRALIAKADAEDN